MNSDGNAPMLSLSSHGWLQPRGSRDEGAQTSSETTTGRSWLVQPGNLVINPMWLEGGGIAISSIAGAVSPDYRVFEVNEDALHLRYLHYLLRSQPYRDQYRLYTRADTTFDRRVSRTTFSSLPVLMPPLGTQRRIADMLDAETARIDTLIEKVERLVDLIWQRYRAKRLQLLAGGFRLGSPNAHAWASSRGWRLAPIWLASINHDSRRIPLNSEERGRRPGSYPYWGANSIQDHIDGWLFDGPHVLIGEDGAPFFEPKRDVAWVAEGKYWVNNHAHVLEAVGVEPWWLAECLNVVEYSLFITGSTRDKLTQESLNRIPIPVPDTSEQLAVLAELNEAREAANAITDRSVRQIELLRLRRQALITAAVTGQIEV